MTGGGYTGRVEGRRRAGKDRAMPLFTIRRRAPKLPPAYTLDWHPFIADQDGISCRVCRLPRANRRHGESKVA